MKIGDERTRELESTLIRQLRTHDSISRVELAKRLELAPSTIGQYVDRLIDGGFLKEGRKAEQPLGRPPTVLELNPAAGHFVGVDFEARQVWVIAVNFAQEPLCYRKARIIASDSAERVIKKIVTAIEGVSLDRGPLLGIGVGVPGAIDARHGIGLHYKFIRGWNEIPLRQTLAERFGVPVHLENNIRAIALAEELFGQGRGLRNFICIGIRSGIAAGIVIDGELYTGPGNLAGEIGSWPCGGDSSLEQLVSVTALVERLEREIRTGGLTNLSLKRDRLSPEDIFQAARSGDGLVLDVLRQMGGTIGVVSAQLNLLLNPERIIIAGPLAEFAGAFVQPIRDTLELHGTHPHAATPDIAGSTLGEFAGALGGAALAARHWSPANP